MKIYLLNTVITWGSQSPRLCSPFEFELSTFSENYYWERLLSWYSSTKIRIRLFFDNFSSKKSWLKSVKVSGENLSHFVYLSTLFWRIIVWKIKDSPVRPFWISPGAKTANGATNVRNWYHKGLMVSILVWGSELDSVRTQLLMQPE